MWWMAFASSGNKVSSYLWASVFLQTQQCWKVPATSQANPEWDCWVGLPRLIGGIPAPACCHWCHRCWNLQRALQADLLCRVKGREGMHAQQRLTYIHTYIFTLFTKKSQFTPAQVPLQVDIATTPELIHFFFFCKNIYLHNYKQRIYKQKRKNSNH